MRHRDWLGIGILGLGAALLGGCTVQTSDEASAGAASETAGSEQEAIQSAQLGSGAFARSAVLFTNDQGTAATGAVHIPLGKRGDGTPIRGTCGVTFISPHFAITAAHCVSKNFPSASITTSTKLKVEHYDATGLDKDKVNAQAVVHGRFPNYTRDPLTAAEGYGVTTYNQCFVRRRCSTNAEYGRDACPLAANDSADIALLECTDRGFLSSYVPVASSDTIGEAVRMYWYHEVLNLPAKDPNSPGSTNQDRWDHYGGYLTTNEPDGVDHNDRTENFHYFGGNHNQLLPLISFKFDTRNNVSLEHKGKVTYTNLGGCHGSSGSGIFHTKNGKLELLGPVSTGAFSGLCSGIGPDNFDDNLLSYTALKYTQALAGVAEIQDDIEDSRARLQDIIGQLPLPHFIPNLPPFPEPGPDDLATP